MIVSRRAAAHILTALMGTADPIQPIGASEMNPKKPSLPLLVKLGSIIVHADETLSDDGRIVDQNITMKLIADPEVQGWIREMGALLPLKRKASAER